MNDQWYGEVSQALKNIQKNQDREHEENRTTHIAIFDELKDMRADDHTCRTDINAKINKVDKKVTKIGVIAGGAGAGIIFIFKYLFGMK